MSVPVVASIDQAETLLEAALGAYANCPDGVSATYFGDVPAGNGEPVTAVSAPVAELIDHPEMLFDPLLAA